MSTDWERLCDTPAERADPRDESGLPRVFRDWSCKDREPPLAAKAIDKARKLAGVLSNQE